MFSVQTSGINEKVKFNAVLDCSLDDTGITEPVTKDEVKAWCKINTGTAEDDLLDALITTARQQCEDFTGVSFVSRETTCVINNSCGGIYLPYGPVTLPVTSIKDMDDEDITNAVFSGTVFPQLITPAWDRITLVYDSGYETLPEKLKIAVLQQIFYLYNNRGEEATANRSGMIVELTLSPQARATLQRIKRR